MKWLKKMCAASSRSSATAVQSQVSSPATKVKVEGGAKVRFELDGARTVLKDLYQHDPVRILFPDNPPGELTIGVLTTTSGGLVGGDKVGVEVIAGPGTQSMIMAQAAEKIYRSLGADCLIEISIQAEDGCWFEWLPQETILHQGARLRRNTKLHLSGTARIMAGEFLVFGRHAMGEKMTEGLVHDSWDVSREGRAIWADVFHLDGELDKKIDCPAGLGGATGLASLVYAAPDAREYLSLAQDLLGEQANIRSAVTFVNDVLVARWIGTDVFSLRKAYADFWKKFRNQAGGQPEQLPRLWDI